MWGGSPTPPLSNIPTYAALRLLVYMLLEMLIEYILTTAEAVFPANSTR